MHPLLSLTFPSLQCANFFRGAVPPLLNEDENVDIDLLIPINSSFSDPHAAFMQLGRGTHWSLLHIRVCRSVTTTNLHHVHYDSCPRNSNLATATSFRKTLNSSLIAAYGHASIKSSTQMTPLTPFPSSGTMKQSDGWSCGWYTVFFARTIILNAHESQPSYNHDELSELLSKLLSKYKIK